MQLERVLEAPGAGAAPEGLAEALLLIRGNALKLARLQLALERNDRQVALEAVDELVAFDRRLGEQLAKAFPAPNHAYLLDQLEIEQSALNREKLTLAAGISNGRCGREAQQRPAPARIEAPNVELETDAVPTREVVILLGEDPEERPELFSGLSGISPQITAVDPKPRMKLRITIAIFLILAVASAAIVGALFGFPFARDSFEAISNWH